MNKEKGGALGSGVFSQNDKNQENTNRGSCRTWGLSGLFVLAVAYLANEVLVVSPIKWHGPVDQGIQQHPESPAVHLMVETKKLVIHMFIQSYTEHTLPINWAIYTVRSKQTKQIVEVCSILCYVMKTQPSHSCFDEWFIALMCGMNRILSDALEFTLTLISTIITFSP